MDTFTEQLEVRQNTSKDITKLIIYLLLIFAVPGICILLGVTVNFYFIVVAVCAFFFAVYASYYLVTGLYVEYEYAVTNSNITVDKISGKRSRKRIISVDIKRFNSLAKLKDSDVSKKSYRKIFKASITPDGDDVFAAEMHLDKFGGDCLLLFSPNQKTLDAMMPHLRNNIRLELKKAGFDITKSNRQVKTDTVKTNTTKTVTTKTDTTKADTAKAVTTKVDTAKADTAKTDTAKVDTAKADTAKVDTAKADTAKTDAAKTNTAKNTNTNKSKKKKSNKKK